MDKLVLRIETETTDDGLEPGSNISLEEPEDPESQRHGEDRGQQLVIPDDLEADRHTMGIWVCGRFSHGNDSKQRMEVLSQGRG
jgi:hypothetical protein